MEQPENQPPSWAIRLLRFIVHPEFQEEIEGDLLEKYRADLQKYRLNVARKRLYAELFSILKPNLVFNVNRNPMKARNWLLFLLIAFVVVVASVAPFLPGPGNEFSHHISRFAQMIGYFGLAFLPFGLIWFLIEMRNKKGQKLNRWTNGYYPAWLTMTPVFLFFPLQTVMAILEEWAFNLLLFAVISLVAAFFIYRIQKLKSKTDYKFNPAPLYIVLIPLITLFTSRFAVEKAAAFSREKHIVKTEPLIEAIEKYKTAHGKYPEKLEELEGKYIPKVPTLYTMGIRPYQYEKRNDSFQLSFEQLWHWSATEVVVYHTLGQKGIKGGYENYPTDYTNWWYYLAD